MKRLLTTLLFFPLLLIAGAQAPMEYAPFMVQTVASAPAPTYLINQNFEGTGYDNSETWTETLNGGTVDEDYTTIVLAGSQSLLMTDTATALCQTVSPNWSSSSNIIYGYFLFRMDVRPTAASAIMLFRSGSNVRGSIEVLNTGTVRIDGNIGSPVGPTVTAMNADTLYHVWWSLDVTSSPETWTLAFSTDGVRPTSGNNFISGTSDTSSAINNVLLTPVYTSDDTIFDRLLVDDVQIGDNP